MTYEERINDFRAARDMEPWTPNKVSFDEDEMRSRALEALRPPPNRGQQMQQRQQPFIRLGQQKKRMSPRQMALARLQQAIPGAPR
tara:strand:- start:4420 stop:4677 length:258 start_codon:yes stop_codon:yes gene_type:complete